MGRDIERQGGRHIERQICRQSWRHRGIQNIEETSGRNGCGRIEEEWRRYRGSNRKQSKWRRRGELNGRRETESEAGRKRKREI